MANVYFISDLHLGHSNILKFGQRSFDSIEEHDDALVQSWNSVVRPNDLVWVLGDVAMDVQALDRAMSRMVGRKRLILGNHDTFDTQVYLKYFERVSAFEKRYHGLVMTHIPIHPQEMQWRNWKTNVHGHIHNGLIDLADEQYINVNVDIVGMIPVSLDQLRERIEWKTRVCRSTRYN